MTRGLRTILAIGVALSALWSSACGDGSGGMPDASAPDAGADGAVDAGADPFAPTPPSPAELPRLGECPDGWRPVSRGEAEGAVEVCEPWPEGGLQDCSGAEAHLPGTGGCAPIGTPCPDGPFAAGLPDTGVVYVQQGATDGDGSRASPFGTLSAAITAASSGDVIALSKGSFDGILRLPDGVTLQGACAAETDIGTTVATTSGGVIHADEGEVTVRDLRVRQSPRNGVWVNGFSTTLRLEGVVVEGAVRVGVTVSRGATLEADGLVVRGTRTQSDGRFGLGMNLERGASVDLRRAAVVGNHDRAIFVINEGTELTLADSVVRDTEADGAGNGGRGLGVETGAVARVERSAFEDNRQFGVSAVGRDARLQVLDSVVRGTLPDASFGDFGRGVQVELGGEAEVRRSYVQGNHEFGAFAYQEGSSLLLEDVVVADTQPHPGDGMLGYGVGAEVSSDVTLRRTLLERNRSFGLLASNGSSTTVESLTIRETLPDESGESAVGGDGMGIAAGARVTGGPVLMARNHDSGAIVTDAETTVALQDVTIRDTRPVENDFGRAMSVLQGAEVTLTRAALLRNAEIAVLAVDPGTLLRLEDVAIRDTRPRGTDGKLGRALDVELEARLEMTRGVIAGNRDTGVFLGRNGTARLESVAIRDTASDADGLFGRGVIVQEAASAELLDCELSGNHEIAVYANGGSSVRMERVTVRGTRPRPADGRGGRGLDVETDSTAEVVDSRFVDNHEIGVMAIGSGADVAMRGVEVLGVRESECTGECPGGAGGNGVGSYYGGQLAMNDFVVRDADLCGVHVAGAEMDLENGEVASSSIGACVQVEGYDVERLTGGVTFEDNEVTLDAVELPVPEPGDTVPFGE